MTIHAYNELYLNDATKSLANAFDYAINDCKIEPDWFAELFAQSDLSKQFERGNPSIISGKSGEEIVRSLLIDFYKNKKIPKKTFVCERTPEYWAGWALAQYQWVSCKKFKDIFERISLSEIISMYSVFHEMDITNFYESIDKKFDESISDTKLKKIRENSRISQQELAAKSGVNIRSIQLYEQKVNDIDKAQAQTLYKLSRVLGCDIEDLLEKPEKI